MAVIDWARSMFGNAPAAVSAASPSLSSLMWREMLSIEERRRLDAMNQAWDVYLGNLRQPLAVKPNGPNDNVAINYGRIIVDKTVSFLFGQELQFEISTGETTPAETWLDNVWKVNRKAQLLQKVAVNGAVCGHAFVKVVLPAGGGAPRLINLPPEYVAVFTDSDDIDSVWRYLIQFGAEARDGSQMVKRQTISRDEAGRWEVVDEESRNGGRFEVTQGTVWPYDWPPIIDCQNLPAANDYYGLPDLTGDVVNVVDAYNFVRSNIQRILRFHAHPRTVGTGFMATELKMDVDGTVILPSADAKMYTLEMTSDLTGSMQQAQELETTILQLTRTPPVTLARVDGVGQLSGVALRILYGPMLEKTETKRLTYGGMIVELNRRLLEVGGYGAENETMLRWPDMLPANRLEELQGALLAEQIGVSKDTLIGELGYNAAQEKEKKAAEGADLGGQLLTAFDRGENAERA